MFNRILALVFVGASLLAASAASAADCTISEKKSMQLDWQRDSSDRPQVDKPLRILKGECVKGAANTLDIYYFQQVFPNQSFGTMAEVEELLKAVRANMALRKRMNATEIEKSTAAIEDADKASKFTGGKTVIEIKKPEVVIVSPPTR